MYIVLLPCQGPRPKKKRLRKKYMAVALNNSLGYKMEEINDPWGHEFIGF